MNSASRGAAGLRRSANAERICLREEWSALKGDLGTKQKQSSKATKKQHKPQKSATAHEIITRSHKSSDVNEALRGLVVLVEVGVETRALPLRAALTALGASVVPAWSPLVTHVVWSQGGCRSTRAKARALACRLVSPLWVEACAADGRRLPERLFPAPTRPSDLPSPGALKRFLKKAEAENIPLHTLLPDSAEGAEGRRARLRLSSETERDTSHDTSRDTSHDTSRDTSHDTSKENSHDATDVEARVNTAPRRKSVGALNKRPGKSKRKLFTQKEPELQTTDDEENDETTAGPKVMQPSKMTQRNRKDLAHAEKIARLLIGGDKRAQTQKRTIATQNDKRLRIVLTGMSNGERREAFDAVTKLNGIVQQRVDRKTTHVIMGSCLDIPSTTITTRQSPKTTRKSPKTTRKSPKTNNLLPLSICNKCNSPEKLLSNMFSRNVRVEDLSKHNKNRKDIICKCNSNISGVKNISDITDNNLVFPVELGCNNNRINLDTDENEGFIGEIRDSMDILDPFAEFENINIENEQNCNRLDPVIEVEENDENLGLERETGNNNLCTNNVVKPKPRTVNALLGAARGCRVLRYEWVMDSLRANRWLHHIGYEVQHLKKISQKARVERSALHLMHKDYACDVFSGMRVRVFPAADHRDSIAQLLTLCGAVIVTAPQSVTDDIDLTVGTGAGEVSSKWVFDSVAAARMRTTRRYINNS
ncbi:uncharacterized protein LOC112057683 [Bicyclus anynana]|uniref:Uncharacterized protein LOC112057683 n=1 Tax=Bicyclus anynana TaxID=110368 RepID=A0ABM3LZJ0_BICAN|nr:uncharacterized protein LOC112057683 [Bicyclus anynana]